MKISVEDRASILIEALPYIQKYYNKILVIKYGGNAMINDDLKNCVMRDIVLLNAIGIKVVLVHGGGPEISDTLKSMNKDTHFVNGLRYTDKETAEVVQMVLAGKINKTLVNLLENIGGKALGLCGIDGHMLESEMIDEELGFVGNIKTVNAEVILNALDKNYIPVISTIGFDKIGNVYNINADSAASAIAGALNAESLILMTDIKGLLRDKDDLDSLIEVVNVSDIPSLVRQGIIKGGMIPKVACCGEAIRRGVKRVFILDGRVPHSILMEVLSDEGSGTMFK